jgi:hypothetical protein
VRDRFEGATRCDSWFDATAAKLVAVFDGKLGANRPRRLAVTASSLWQLRDRRRRVGRVGAYHPHRFLISFDATVPFLKANRTRARRYFHLFAHEYFHYWHNLSTISGFKLFAYTQHLLAAFTATLVGKQDSLSVGSAGLAPDQLHHPSELLALAIDLDGEGAPKAEFLFNLDVSMVVTGATADQHQEAPWHNARVPNPSMLLALTTILPNGTAHQGQLRLGAYAIEEGIALLVEEHVAGYIGDAKLDPVPDYPYRLLERTIEHIVGTRPSPFIAAALGTLALLSTFPGPVLAILADLYKSALGELGTEEAALARVVELTDTHRKPEIATTRAGLANLVQMQRGRGLSEGALEHFRRLHDAAMTERERDPFVDLRAVFHSGRPIGALAEFMERFPSCDVLQEVDGPDDQVQRDRMLGEPATNADGFTTSECIRTLHAQQDFLYAHVDQETGEFLSSAEARSCCPYFTTCALPQRIASSEVCSTQPWRTYDPTGPLCPYAAAVAASLGLVQLRRSS